MAADPSAAARTAVRWCHGAGPTVRPSRRGDGGRGSDRVSKLVAGGEAAVLRQARERRVSVVRLHDLRRGAATLAHAAAPDLTDHQEMLGHSSITSTADTYTSLLPEADPATDRRGRGPARTARPRHLQEQGHRSGARARQGG
ncbi:hypothetical protein [Streptomyces sp. cf386]|uniref:hypothetical protein n=1 Tax=Streptomyces sp. cf386 TaxID=1761904 RepID=UPI0015A43B2D|nr:hypothetical protein [Streptomyces sp. cf386]